MPQVLKITSTNEKIILEQYKEVFHEVIITVVSITNASTHSNDFSHGSSSKGLYLIMGNSMFKSQLEQKVEETKVALDKENMFFLISKYIFS